MQIANATACTAAVILFILCVILPIITLPYWTINLLGQTNELKNLVEIPSPNGSIIADEFNVYGGATSHNLTQVVMRERTRRFDWWNGNCVFSIDGLKKAKVKWISDSQLQIQYEPGTVYRTFIEWKGVHVLYSELK